MAVQMAVILVPVLFGLMGFAVDLGQIYLVKGELKTAADAAALAAAARLLGTTASSDAATTAAAVSYNPETTGANRYYFAGLPLGQTLAMLNSTVPAPTYYQTAADATAGGGSEVASQLAHYARVSVTADVPLTFWSFLSLGQSRKTPVQMTSVAGLSAPLCTACGIEPIAVAPIDASDTVNFGFTLNQRYTFYHTCTGTAPSAFSDATTTVEYLLLDRFNESSTVYPTEDIQLYRMGLAGLPPVAGNPALSCFKINDTDTPEGMWPTVSAGTCRASAPVQARYFLCGLTSRFDALVPEICSTITGSDSAVTAYAADTDITSIDDYTAYAGNGRRIITVPIVDTVNTTSTMLILGYRQFLVNPNPSPAVQPDATDAQARFEVLYMGSPAPVKQGQVGGCSAPVSAGPGKVVLHQ
jgi:Flp pilus assembly protein TadG